MRGAAGVPPVLAAGWFQALYDNPDLLFLLLTADGTVVEANRAAVEGCGWDRATTLGRPVAQGGWWGADDGRRDRLARRVRYVVEQGASVRRALWLSCADGTRRLVDLHVAPLRDEHGRVTHLAVTGNDQPPLDGVPDDADLRGRLVSQADTARHVATARAQDAEDLRGAEADLARALRLTAKILDNIGDGIYGLDEAGRAEFVNPAAVRLTGYAAEDLLGQDLHALLHSRRADGAAYPLQECPSFLARATGQTRTGPDEVFWRADGSALAVSVVAVPILDGEAVHGCVVSFRDVTPLREAAAQAELLAQVTRREAEQRALADRLQQALLTPPPEPDQLHVVVRYRPAASEAQVGGDWYDAFLQPDGATVLVIGDVVGHDHEAAATMGQLRGILRTLGYSRGAAGPAEILRAVDRTALGLDVDGLATVLLARVERRPDVPDAGTRTLRWSNAGHLPPLLLTADGRVTCLDSPPDLLLGVDVDTARTEHTAELPDGSTLLLFTDGLVERRGESLDDGLARLQQVLAGLVDLPLDALCDRLLDQLAADGDDVALLAVRAHPEDRPRPLEAEPDRLPPTQA